MTAPKAKVEFHLRISLGAVIQTVDGPVDMERYVRKFYGVNCKRCSLLKDKKVDGELLFSFRCLNRDAAAAITLQLVGVPRA
ncbi:hypothetical protein [Variovorax sp. RA8]|uniref:hypothetical protein n=1 Tax=Variovorax sp. (strain JCM 16519 / RA8) TaxID=662548 RepID=UPI000AABDD22|nr:hypothetical protein [Variovorax sp. RA8]VTU44352.1 hypothetical protein RA8P2_00135 [Variovorax sp. RA8]